MEESFMEFLEIVINQYLYLRAVYPSQIFKQQKAFGLSVFVSIYPPLNNYIDTVLQETRCLLEVNKLNNLELRLHNDDKTFERLFLSININTPTESIEALESDFRSYIHNLDNRCKSLSKLTKDCRFKILLHTKSYDFSNLAENENSVWIEDSMDFPENSEVVPVAMSSKIESTQCFIEIFHSN